MDNHISKADDDKKAERREKQRERYQSSKKCKHNIVTLKDSDEEVNDDSKEKRKRKTVGKKNVKHQTTEVATSKSHAAVDAQAREDAAAGKLLDEQANQLILECEPMPSLPQCTSQTGGQGFTDEQAEMVDNQVKELLAKMEAHETSMLNDDADETVKSAWQRLKTAKKEEWNEKRPLISLARTAFESPSFTRCASCFNQTLKNAITCKDCYKEFCPKCDEEQHKSDPFHHRVYYEKESLSSTTLKPTEFVDDVTLQLKRRGMMVPCFAPSINSICSHCLKSGTLSLVPGSMEKKIVTLDGRFDVSCTAELCSDCGFKNNFSEIQYIQNGWWPGALSGSSYLFSEKLLEFWYHVDHKYHGASTKKFVAVLSHMASNAQRNSTIDIPLFDKASREYILYRHNENYFIRKQDHTVCPSCSCQCCGDPNHIPTDPLVMDGTVLHKKQAILDGNFKVPRLASASNGDGQSLLKEALISSNDSVSSHIQHIDANYKPEKGSIPCGGAVFTAARDSAKKKKNYKETGLLVSCCRHLITLLAVNIFCGESYRHVHFVHEKLYQMGYTVFYYDIVCLYWKWAKKIGDLTPEFRERFKPLTEKMIKAMPRWHGIAHVWHCYIKNIGHYQSGVGATIGEEMEQVNATLSLYGNKTKHMTEENRNDTVTAGLLYLNRERVNRMAKFLTKRLARARLLATAFSFKLGNLLTLRGLTELDLPAKAAGLRKSAEDCADKNEDSTGPPSYLMKELEGLFVQHQYAQKRVEESASCIPRQKAVRQRNEAKKRASKLIEKINSWHFENAEEDDDPSDLITMEDFLTGTFPWVLPHKKDDFMHNRELVDVWQLSIRYKEEIILCKSDMDSFGKSCEFSITSLQHDLVQLTQTLDHSNSNEETRFVRAKGYIMNQEISRLTEVMKEAKYLFSIDYDYYTEKAMMNQMMIEQNSKQRSRKQKAFPVRRCTHVFLTLVSFIAIRFLERKIK